MCVLVLSLVILLPIYGTLYFDGLSHVLKWPAMFYCFLVVGLALVGVAIWLIRAKPAGAAATFNRGGFTLSVQQFFRRKRISRLDWRDIEEVKLLEVPRGGDVLAFRLTYDAAIREGLIKATTREDASKKLVRREVQFPIKLSRAGNKDAVARFTRSAENAGARLVKQTSLNVVVYARYIWSVEWPTS